MAAYATEQQFIDQFGQQETIQLTNLEDPSAVAVDTAVLQAALDRATEEIDSFIVQRYDLPLVVLPVTLVQACMDIARYRLDNNSTRDNVEKRYDDAIRWLRWIAEGKVSLNVPVAEEGEAAGDVIHSAPPRVFSSTSLSQFAGDI